MKFFAALVLVLALLPLAALAEAPISEGVSLAYFEDNDAVFEAEYSEDGEEAWFQTRAKAESRAFDTPYDNATYYSVIFPELAVRNYSRPAEREGELRIWIRYRGTKALDVDAVSVLAGGEEYRFLDVYEPERAAQKEDGTFAQDIAIRMGSNLYNATCFSVLLAEAYDAAVRMASSENAELPKVRLLLHGMEEAEIVPPAAFWQEMALFAAFVQEQAGNARFLTRGEGTPCVMAIRED